MSPRTKTTHFPSISLPTGGTFSFPVPASPSSRTSYSLPPGSAFDSNLHWHEAYTEYFRITQGVMRVILEDQNGNLNIHYIGKESGIVEIPRGRRHRLRRGDQGQKWEPWMSEVEWKEGGKIAREVWEMEVRGEEWTSPMDGRKEAFFRNIAGVVAEPRSVRGGRGGIRGLWEGVMVVLGALTVLREFDNWPAVLGGRFRRVEWVLSHVILLIAAGIGVCVGLKGSYEEYTPKELRKGLVNGKAKNL
jgi:hypothetical protein